MRQKLLKIFKKIALTLFTIAVLPATVTFLYMQKAIFGKAPAGERLARIQASPHFKDGQFQNLHPTPQLTEGYNMLGVAYNQLFKKAGRRKPSGAIPSVKTDLRQLPPEANVLVWFGHSSYFMQLHGKRFLIDPVFSGNASPLPGTIRAFAGTDVYTAADFPEIDYLLISHDHYDHVDYATLLPLKSKIKTVVCGLGVGAHFEHWGYKPENIVEKDWNEKIELDGGLILHTAPARHFSGRGFSRNNTLWLSYVLQSGDMKIYIGGDSGYDTHFADIGKRLGPVDLAILDCGQYNLAWRLIHMLPPEVLLAAQDLKARRLFPVHSGKFALSNHAWDEPLTKLTELNAAYNFPLVTPMIGQVVALDNEAQSFKQWWVEAQ